MWEGLTASNRGSPFLLNIGYVSNETNTDARMYIEEFILVEIWIHCCTKLKLECEVITLENTLVFIHTQQ